MNKKRLFSILYLSNILFDDMRIIGLLSLGVGINGWLTPQSATIKFFVDKVGITHYFIILPMMVAGGILIYFGNNMRIKYAFLNSIPIIIFMFFSTWYAIQILESYALVNIYLAISMYSIQRIVKLYTANLARDIIDETDK